jgi:hypothetical protein
MNGSEKKIKLLIAEGDSWTSGDILNPELERKGITDVNSPFNDTYRLPKVWPSKLGTKLSLQVKNFAVAGSSNDGIVRRTINNVLRELENHSPEEIFVIVGWSSPERKDFFRNGSWDTVYPMEIQRFSHSDTDEDIFKRIYAQNYWNEEEFITRYLLGVITLESFLNLHHIPHLFFNGFYENEFGITEQESELNFVQKFVKTREISYLSYLHIDKLTQQYNSIRNVSYMKKLFSSYINENIIDEQEEYFKHYHPTEKSHELWAEYIEKVLRNGQFSRRFQ